ncbi:hypothetical protein Skr01_33600 [Sphaerisporangium krabiense]|uniref:Uncharacterized protein n=1 Tax=Sphaerisporangium krabiense TaxID=763782 RepID=A0A7W8Z2V3_9ACTN|nr:hypothetical protein [Sphaerisporangium krabiense]MBB5626360.1 hypothetical protein [Sphaerisporangium krabiense]GII63275.1 hypothetical protein Skr01_33600 [Sphaerisporangium krabiense]
MEPFARSTDYETEARKALQKGDTAAAQVWATLQVATKLGDVEDMLNALYESTGRELSALIGVLNDRE